MSMIYEACDQCGGSPVDQRTGLCASCHYEAGDLDDEDDAQDFWHGTWNPLDMRPRHGHQA